MQKRFGFIASAELISLIEDANNALNSNEKDMYIYRNRLIEKVSAELIEKMIMDIATRVTESERKENIRSLGRTVGSVVNKIVKVMLSKDKNEIVLQSKPFLEDSIAKDSDGNIRMGFIVPTAFYDTAQSTFITIGAGDNSPKVLKNTKETLKALDDMLLNHFVIEFVKTLSWGSIKMNLAKGTKATISKADSILVDKLVAKLRLDQLQELLPHFQELLFETNIVGLAVLDN